jgi:hypothetical protein
MQWNNSAHSSDMVITSTHSGASDHLTISTTFTRAHLDLIVWFDFLIESSFWLCNTCDASMPYHPYLPWAPHKLSLEVGWRKALLFLRITQYIRDTHNARTLTPMNTRMQTLPLGASSKTVPTNPQDWQSHYRRLAVDGNVAYHWKYKHH